MQIFRNRILRNDGLSAAHDAIIVESTQYETFYLRTRTQSPSPNLKLDLRYYVGTSLIHSASITPNGQNEFQIGLPVKQGGEWIITPKVGNITGVGRADTQNNNNFSEFTFTNFGQGDNTQITISMHDLGVTLNWKKLLAIYGSLIGLIAFILGYLLGKL